MHYNSCNVFNFTHIYPFERQNNNTNNNNNNKILLLLLLLLLLIIIIIIQNVKNTESRLKQYLPEMLDKMPLKYYLLLESTDCFHLNLIENSDLLTGFSVNGTVKLIFYEHFHSFVPGYKLSASPY